MATYCLIIELKKDSVISVGKLGRLNFQKGYYVYVGSALNSIDARIKRHLKSEKKLFWHVDYLLNSQNASIKGVILEKSPDKWECVVADEISKKGILPGKFGCSDCKCDSHLFYFESYDESKKHVLIAFNKFKLNTEVITI
ncbi:MAG: GIY-YIG nuclease family protein [Methanobacteriaceae archaeon]|jgi:Uri superfamily endonuclease